MSYIFVNKNPLSIRPGAVELGNMVALVLALRGTSQLTSIEMAPFPPVRYAQGLLFPHVARMYCLALSMTARNSTASGL